MRIKRVFVKGLFDTFDHDILFNLEDGITLMLGENGMGKTVILRMIKALFEQDFLFLLATPFEKLLVEFSDGEAWELNRKSQPKQREWIELSAKTHPDPEKSYRFPNKRTQRFFEEFPDRFVDEYLRWEGADLPFDLHPDGSSMSWRAIRDTLNNGHSRSPTLERLRSQFNQIEQGFPTWYSDSVQAISIHLIETQRLLRFSQRPDQRARRSSQAYTSTVLALADELKQQIKAKIDESAELATQLDQNFPIRLAQLDHSEPAIDESTIQRKLEDLKEQRNFLRKLGLYQGQQEDQMLQSANTDFMKPVMQVYAADNLKKLAIFHELAQKIDLFQRIINSRFLYKEIRVDKTFGFALFSTLNPKKEIPLSALSSGEQHELVLFYQLLFDLQPHSLILIDEPEISLHVSWQNHFIDDLKAVIKLNPIDILIATHSPSIVGSHWDLTVQLKGVETEASV